MRVTRPSYAAVGIALSLLGLGLFVLSSLLPINYGASLWDASSRFMWKLELVAAPLAAAVLIVAGAAHHGGRWRPLTWFGLGGGLMLLVQHIISYWDYRPSLEWEYEAMIGLALASLVGAVVAGMIDARRARISDPTTA